jgi:hypothetical protein
MIDTPDYLDMMPNVRVQAAVRQHRRACNAWLGVAIL